MKSFEKIYQETVELFEEGIFKDQKWRKKLFNNLKTLKQLWPTYDHQESSELVKDNTWRVEQIFQWSYMSDDQLNFELELHGSLNFYYLSQLLEESDAEEIIKNFRKTNFRIEDTNHVLTEMVLKKIDQVSKKSSFKKTTIEERRIEKLNKLDKSIWNKLAIDCKSWEYNIDFIDLLNKLSNSKSKINKKDSDFFISQIEDLIYRNYLKKSTYFEIIKIFSV
ncbi:MAG: hypothetical protein VW946_05455 [Gammaproteobacteria bacterium]